MHRIRFGLAVICLGVFTFAARAQDANPGAQKGERLEKQIRLTVRSNYLLFLPQDYGKDPNKKWPVILFLHGSGERGDNVDLVKLHGPPKVVERKKDFPFIVISPQCPANKWWEPVTVVALLDEILAKYSCDPDRVYLTGLSMGGFGTWDVAMAYPDRFAALAPVCGKGNPFRVPAISHIPTWIFHGEQDKAVPISASVEMAAAMKQVGADVRFTHYPDLGHDCWTVTYDDQKLYDWFLEHKRTTRPPANAARK